MVSRLLLIVRSGSRLVPASPITATRLRMRSERGATAVEYGLMVALIAAVIIGAVVFLSGQTQNTFECTANSVRAASNQC